MYKEVVEQAEHVKESCIHVPAAIALARMTLDLIERLEISEAKVERMTTILIDQLGERLAHLEAEVSDLRKKK